MDWSSFLIGVVCGGLSFGMLGILTGGIMSMTGHDMSESDLTRIIRHAGKEIPVGDVISFTMGHDVMIPCKDDDEDDDDDEEEESPLTPVNGWGRV